MLAIGSDELDDMPELGPTVECWRCGATHAVEYADAIVDGKPVPSKLLAFFRCGGESYMCGIKGRELRPKGAK